MTAEAREAAVPAEVTAERNAGTAAPDLLSSRHHLPDGGPWSAAYRRTTAGLLLVIASGAFEVLAVGTILPATVDDLGGLHLYGWAFSAYLLANLVGLVIAGNEADHRGPGAPFVAGTLIFSAGLLIGGLAPAMLILILARAIQGVGGGLVNAVAYVVVGRGYPESARPRMLALMSTAWVVPGLVGPGLAGLVADHVGWRWVFLAIIPLPLLAAALAVPPLRLIPSGSLLARDWARLRNAVRVAAGMALMLAGFGASSVGFGVPLVAIGLGVALPPLLRLLPPGTLSAQPGLPAAILVMALLNLAFFGVDAFVPLALVDVRHTSTSFAGLALTAATLTWTAGSWIQAHMVRRTGPRWLVRVGLATIAVGVLLTIVVIATSVPVASGVIAWGIAGLGIGLSYSALSLLVLEGAPPGQEGSASAAMQIANNVGISLATGLGGILIAVLSREGTSSPESLVTQFALMTIVLFVALIAAHRLSSQLRSEPFGEQGA
jgi:MFS family permease